MCGILGGFSNEEIDKCKLDHCLSLIRHRGPDSDGSYISSDKKLYLGHTRLAILRSKYRWFSADDFFK